MIVCSVIMFVLCVSYSCVRLVRLCVILCDVFSYVIVCDCVRVPTLFFMCASSFVLGPIRVFCAWFCAMFDDCLMCLFLCILCSSGCMIQYDVVAFDYACLMCFHTCVYVFCMIL